MAFLNELLVELLKEFQIELMENIIMDLPKQELGTPKKIPDENS